MCKEHENRMMFDNFPDHIEEPDPDEDRELYPPERFIECPNCGEITYRLVNVSEAGEEFECENCWHYGVFPVPNAKKVKDEIMKEFDRIIGVIKDFK